MEEKRTALNAGEFRLVLSPEPGAGSKARQAVRHRFHALPDSTLTDLVAVVTELVNNAVSHGPARPITLMLAEKGDSIHGEVADQGNPAAAIPEIKKAGAASLGGLSLVDKLASDWAVFEGSTHVWFELPLT
jgi:anti-sigma regulatory factor (Ser/Thr protein kinase)